MIIYKCDCCGKESEHKTFLTTKSYLTSNANNGTYFCVTCQGEYDMYCREIYNDYLRMVSEKLLEMKGRSQRRREVRLDEIDTIIEQL